MFHGSGLGAFRSGWFPVSALTRLERAIRDAAPVGLREAKGRWAERCGVDHYRPILSAPAANAKLGKNERPTWSLFLRPAYRGTCPRSTPGCRGLCLGHSAGRNVMGSVQGAQTRRTDFLVEDPGAFVACLRWECARIRSGSALRLNGTADIRWELILPDLIDSVRARDVVPYDYTKWPPAFRGSGIELTYSASERWSDVDIVEMARSYRVAVAAAESWPVLGTVDVPVIDGDVSDERWLDGPGIIALAPKGALAKADRSGFVRR